jgi:hypothetical protein
MEPTAERHGVDPYREVGMDQPAFRTCAPVEYEEFWFDCICGQRMGGTCIVGVDAEFTCARCGTIHTAAIQAGDGLAG